MTCAGWKAINSRPGQRRSGGLIIETVALRGGHSLQYGRRRAAWAAPVVDSPRDIMLWDTGHQTYRPQNPYRRRRAQSPPLAEGGLAGYPSRSESSTTGWRTAMRRKSCLCPRPGAAGPFAAPTRAEGSWRSSEHGSMTVGWRKRASNNRGQAASRVIIVSTTNASSYVHGVPPVANLDELRHKQEREHKYKVGENQETGNHPTGRLRESGVPGIPGPVRRPHGHSTDSRRSGGGGPTPRVPSS